MLYDDFISGKTDLRYYVRSKWRQKNEVSLVFEDLIRNAKFKHIFLSYNNEGLMSVDEVRRIMSKYGRYDLSQIPYQRFKATRPPPETTKLPRRWNISTFWKNADKLLLIHPSLTQGGWRGWAAAVVVAFTGEAVKRRIVGDDRPFSPQWRTPTRKLGIFAEMTHLFCGLFA